LAIKKAISAESNLFETLVQFKKKINVKENGEALSGKIEAKLMINCEFLKFLRIFFEIAYGQISHFFKFWQPYCIVLYK